MTGMKSAALLLYLMVSIVVALKVVVTLQDGEQVDVLVRDPTSMTVGKFRIELSKRLSQERHLEAFSVALCNPGAYFSLDQTPILPLEVDPSKSFYDYGIYSINPFGEQTVELPQSFFSFTDVNTKKNIVLTGCAWSKPEEVLSKSALGYRIFKVQEKAAAAKEELKEGHSVYAFETLEEAKNAAKDRTVQVVSENYCTFTVDYSPTNSFAASFLCNDNTTVAQLRSSVQLAVRQGTNDAFLSAALPLCAPDMEKNGGLPVLSDKAKLAEVYGASKDLSFFTPAKFVRIQEGPGGKEWDIPMCPGMTRTDFEVQLRKRVGLVDFAPIVMRDVVVVNGDALKLKKARLSNLFFDYGTTPKYMIRVAPFPANQYEANANILARLFGSDKKWAEYRGVIIAGLLMIFGLLLLFLAMFSDSSPKKRVVHRKTAYEEPRRERYVVEPTDASEVPEVSIQVPELPAWKRVVADKRSTRPQPEATAGQHDAPDPDMDTASVAGMEPIDIPDSEAQFSTPPTYTAADEVNHQVTAEDAEESTAEPSRLEPPSTFHTGSLKDDVSDSQLDKPDEVNH